MMWSNDQLIPYMCAHFRASLISKHDMLSSPVESAILWVHIIGKCAVASQKANGVTALGCTVLSLSIEHLAVHSM